mgnify:CR=1 FL=1
MKLVLNSFFLSLFFFCVPVFGEDYHKEFTVKVSGIKIGKLNWTIKIDDDEFFNDLKLKSEGVLSGIYRFEGEYFSEGVFQNNKLKPTKYKHVWITNKTTKNMSLVFQDDKLKSLDQTPVEKEKLRINVFNINQSKDPLTSFLQIILGEKNSLVVDGRRTYVMNSIFNKKTEQTVVEISKYSNLWADHKRRKFEKLTFEKKDGDFFPIKINIHFDGRVFKLEQN